jgi:hypothetical protein
MLVILSVVSNFLVSLIYFETVKRALQLENLQPDYSSPDVALPISTLRPFILEVGLVVDTNLSFLPTLNSDIDNAR